MMVNLVEERDRVTVLKMQTDVTSLEGAVRKIEQLQSNPMGSYICLSNVHMCMESFDSSEFEGVVNSADLVLPDGLPIAKAQKFLGAVGSKQVRGQDLMNAVCLMAVNKGMRIGLYGGSDMSVLERVDQVLKTQFPGLDVAYKFSPPFRALSDAEDSSIVSEITDAGVDVLFVGIGCPKQEKWMAVHKADLSCVMLGVGAAFDFISGSKSHAPRWLQRIGLEWFFRLCSEPTRLWKRYLIQNPRFIYHLICQFLSAAQRK